MAQITNTISPVRSPLAMFNIRNASPLDLHLKISYLVLQVLDLVLTLLAVSIGATELNPVMRASLASPLQLTVMKGGMPLLIAWLIPGKLLIPAIAFLLFVLGWNANELFMYFF